MIKRKTFNIFTATVILALLCVLSNANAQEFVDTGDYDIYSIADYKPLVKQKKESVLGKTPRNALNDDGLGGFFVSNTAHRLEPQQLVLSMRYKYHKLTSQRGTAFRTNESGSVSTLETSVNWVGKWAEWAVTVPLHDWDLNAPRTLPGYASSDTGMGNMKLGWKATYLRDYSYYRFAYGAMTTITTGDPTRMIPAGSKSSDELKIYGCVTTNETDKATANLEIGAVLDSEGEDDRFLYRLGMSYEATEHASIIGELAGEVQGGDDKDSLDLIMGIRFGATETFTLEMVYYKNLRTYRAFGYDDQLQIGYTLKW